MEEANLVDLCKEFVRAMSRAEQALAAAAPKLSKEDRQRTVEEFFRWLDTTEEIPRTGMTREVSRELVGQLTAVLAYSDYRGTTSNYIG